MTSRAVNVEYCRESRREPLTAAELGRLAADGWQLASIDRRRTPHGGMAYVHLMVRESRGPLSRRTIR